VTRPESRPAGFGRGRLGKQRCDEAGLQIAKHGADLALSIVRRLHQFALSGASYPRPASSLVHNQGRMSKDIAFEMAVSSIRFGVGVTREGRDGPRG